MFGKKRKKQDQQPAEPTHESTTPPADPLSPKPEPQQTPSASEKPMAPPMSSGAPAPPASSQFDARPEPARAPTAGPMMSQAFSAGANRPPQEATDDAPIAVEPDKEPTPEPEEQRPSAAAVEAEQQIASIERALEELASHHDLSPLADRERPVDERLSSIAETLRAEHERFTETDNERMNAVGMLQESQQRIEALERELAEVREQSQTPADNEHVQHLEGELHAAREALEYAHRERDEARHALEEASHHSNHDQNERIGHLEHELHQANERVSHVERERDEARQALEHASHHQNDEAQERVSQLEQELNGARERAQHLEHEAHEARQRIEQLERERDEASSSAVDPQQVEELTSAIAAMEQRVDAAEASERSLTERYADAQRRCEELEQQMQERSTSEVGPDEFCAHRRARLATVRLALHKRSEKLYKVKQALEMKASELKDAGEARRQAEQALFEAREQRASSERVYAQVLSMRTKGMAGMFMGGLALAWLALMGAAWFGVNAFVPVEHNAHAAIAADTRGLPDPDASAASWTEFALALPNDPMFIERAAQRMKTRSYDELASPAQLREHLGANAIFESPAPGRVTVTLRGEGGDRTQRVLDTLATSVVAFANETKERRADGAPASVVEPASLESDPIEDPRPAIMAGVAGGVTALLLIGAVGVWRSARRSVEETARETLRDVEATTQSHYEQPPAPGAEGNPMSEM